MIKGVPTYVSLFSAAGVGCYGFKEAGFTCVATSELLQKRIDIQKINKKCEHESGYICGDITKPEVKEAIFKEIKMWKQKGNDGIDVLIATPPCQGMSIINQKKGDTDIARNSLIVESIHLIKDIQPKIFVFENVAAFMKTACTTFSGEVKLIGDVINEELSTKYIIYSRVVNFKNYGSNSSRTRTIVIGVSKQLSEYITPIELFPDYRVEKTLKEVIGDMPELTWGSFDKDDFYHQFRTYAANMREWIKDLKEGESAFDNEDPLKRPHKIVDGKVVQNQQKTGDKYKRQYWDRVAPCIHTRNDLLASQNTIHPIEDRVFSVRELMRMMSIPDSFRWVDKPLDELNALLTVDKEKLLRKEEPTIRQSIGEAVPTQVFKGIADKIYAAFRKRYLSNKEIQATVKEYNLNERANLLSFLKENKLNLCNTSLSRIAELVNTNRESNGAYYTNKFIINDVHKQLPEIKKNSIRILEPSVGVGAFLPFIMLKYAHIPEVIIDVVDIDGDNIEVLKILMSLENIPSNVTINYIVDDFLTHNFTERYDVVVGNPPFIKMSAGVQLNIYHQNVQNKETRNTFSFFIEKAMLLGDYVLMVTPKNLLNTPEFAITRKLLAEKNIYSIIDFGEGGFNGVLIETICFCVNTTAKGSSTLVESIPLQLSMIQKQKYICDEKLPYWVIYRNDLFDDFLDKMEFDIFTAFRDRQITNDKFVAEEILENLDKQDVIRVLKSRNISDNGTEIIDIKGYDGYVFRNTLDTLSVGKYLDNVDVYLTPNMTYNPRVMRKPAGVLVNGSVAILLPKDEGLTLTDEDLAFLSSEKYRIFYRIARNHQTRSLNIDSVSVYWFGRLKEGVSI